jgi:hypothetical protein
MKFLREIIISYNSPVTTIKRYWVGYGGLRELFKSPYFHFALISAIFCGINSPGAWAEKCEAIVPGLLGLSLAGYAILLALGSDDFFKIIKKPIKNTRHSIIEEISNSFLHFIVVQIIAILLSLLYAGRGDLPTAISAFFEIRRALWVVSALKMITGIIGWLFLFYSVTCMLALSFRLFRMIQWICRIPSSTNENDNNNS